MAQQYMPKIFHGPHKNPPAQISKSGINSKEVKSSSDLKIQELFHCFLFTGSQTLTEHPEQFELGNLQNFGRSMGHILLHFCHSLSLICIHRGVEWVEGFLKNFQKNLENYILMPFLSGIFLLRNKIKIKNYPLSLRVSRKALVLLKQIQLYFSFLLTIFLILTGI